MSKFFSEVTLLNQKYILDQDKAVKDVILDFSKKIELIKLIKNIKKKFKKIDIVINNAAYVGDTKIKGWATNFEKLQLIPLLIITPLV